MGKGEQGGKWRSRWPAGRMGHASPAVKGRKDATRSEIWRVGWERQERGARAGRRDVSGVGCRGGSLSTVPGLSATVACSPQPRGSGALWCPAPLPEQTEGCRQRGTGSQTAVAPPVPSLAELGSQLERGWTITRKEGEEVSVLAAGSKEIPAGHILLSAPALLLQARALSSTGRWARSAHTLRHPRSLHGVLGCWEREAMEVPSQELGQEAGLPLRRGAGGTKHPCLAAAGWRGAAGAAQCYVSMAMGLLFFKA